MIENSSNKLSSMASCIIQKQTKKYMTWKICKSYTKSCPQIYEEMSGNEPWTQN